MAWRPILTGAEAARARAAIDAVVAALAEPTVPPGPTLADGGAGLSVAHAYCALAFPGAGHDLSSERQLDQAIDAVASAPMARGLYSGFTGVAWAIEHLHRLAGREDAGDPADDPNDEIVAALIDSVTADDAGAPCDYDLVNGLVGLGVFAVERLPRPGAEALLRRLVAVLAVRARRVDDGLVWWTDPSHVPDWQRVKCPAGYGNCGLAHGVPGAVALLAKAQAAGISEAGPLLEGAVAWLLHQRRAGLGFPGWVVEGAPFAPTRAAWCYGNPGVAAALLLAARATGRAEWEQTALAIAHESIARGVEAAGVVDACLCHGAAGLGHLWNRMHQTTGDAALATVAREWLLRAVDLARPGEGVGGYLTFMGTAEHAPWQPARGLLVGAAGVALALLAGIEEREPEWDRFLLVS